MMLRRMMAALCLSVVDAVVRLIVPLAFALMVIAFVGHSVDADAASATAAPAAAPASAVDVASDASVAASGVAGASDVPASPVVTPMSSISPIALVTPPDRSADLAALQRGAKLFGTYCASCHDAKLVHYGQLRALGFSQAQIDADLNPAGAKAGDPMLAAMHAEDAAKAFGAAPPDLSLAARAKGPAWLYTYLRNFYADPARPLGSNNLLVPNVAMPDVLAGLHGEQIPEFAKNREKSAENGQKSGNSDRKSLDFVGYRLKTPGSMTPSEYDSAMADLVAYMGWLAEPTRLDRHRVGPWVIGFLLIFCVVSGGLVRSYWKSVYRKD